MKKMFTVLCAGLIILTSIATGQPVSTHPRLFIRAADVARLRSWATSSNPMFQQSYSQALAQAVTTYDGQFFPPNLSSGLPLGNLDTAAVPSASWPDMGSSNTEGYPVEAYAELFAFASLVGPDSVTRLEYARRARNLLMYGIHEAAKGENDTLPYRSKLFITYNRANYYGEDWGLTVDWLQASNPPVFSTADKAAIRTVFLGWTQNLLNASTAGNEHPQPVGLVNSTQLLSDTLQLRWAANNYFTGHMRILTLISLALDSADDPADQPTVLSGVAYPSLRSYINNVTGAWLYQQFAVYENPATVVATLGAPNKGLGFAEGGMSVEGFMYGHALGYAFETLLALYTAGYADSTLSGRQINFLTSPYWDNFFNGFLHSVAPVTNSVPGEAYLGQVHQFATYGDLLRFYVTYYDWSDVFGAVGLYDYLTGNNQRLAKARYIVTNILSGGDVFSRYNANNIWGNALATTSVLMFMLFDPAVDPTTIPDPRPSMPTNFASKPLMRLLSRTDWTATASWFTFKNTGATINHQNGDAGCFEFYRKGEWLVKQRAGYGFLTPDYLNTLGLQNAVTTGDSIPSGIPWFLPEVWNRGGQPNNGVNAGDPSGLYSFGQNYTYACAAMTPMYNWPNQWTPSDNATDIVNASRSIIWVKPDLIVLYDRADSKSAGKFKREYFNLAGTLSITSTVATMTTPGGQHLFIQNLLPASASISSSPVETQSALNAWGALLAEGEPSVTRLTIDDTLKPTSTRFLTVLEGKDAGASMDSAIAVNSTSGTPFQGTVVNGISFMFPVNSSGSFTGVVYAVPSATVNFVVMGLTPNSAYTLSQQNNGGTIQITVSNGGLMMTDNAGVLVAGSQFGTGVGIVKNILPSEYRLEQNYPDPFNPSTAIVFSLPRASEISLKVYNLLGQEVSELVSGTRNPGNYSVEFDASRLPSGIYYYRLRAGNFIQTRRMVLIK